MKEQLSQIRESTHSRIKERHTLKLQVLKEKKMMHKDSDLSGTQLKQWVVNLSKYRLTEDQGKVLAMVQIFAVIRDKVPIDEFIDSIEQAT